MSYRTEDINVRGGTLRVGIWEPEEAPVTTVLAVHGITANHQSWAALAEYLPDHRIIAPDLRGRGRSNKLPGPTGMPQHAEDLAAVCAHLGEGAVTCVGHSMGGFVSLVFAHRSPTLVDRIVLVDGGLPLEKPAGITDEQLIQATLGPAAERLAMTFESYEAYHDFWRQHPAFAGDWNHWVENYVDYDLEGQPPTLKPSTSFEAMAEDSKEVTGGTSLLAAIDALNHPTSFLRAQRGMFNQPEGLYREGLVEEWRERLPLLTARTVADVNHYTIVIGDAGAAVVANEVRATQTQTTPEP